MIYAGYDAELTDAYDASIDDWARDREARLRWQRRDDVSLAMTGVDELDAYGEYVWSLSLAGATGPSPSAEGASPPSAGCRWALRKSIGRPIE